jgi:hypothetical protein
MSATTTRRRSARDTSLPADARPGGVGDLLGHARVLTDQQNLALQLDALTGCRRIFRDVGCGSLKQRPRLEECLSFLQPGDTLVVWRLDRLGRGLKHLIEIVEQFQAREIAFKSLTENIDTTTSGGRLTFQCSARLRDSSAGSSAAARAPASPPPGSAVASAVDARAHTAEDRRGGDDARPEDDHGGDRQRARRQRRDPLPPPTAPPRRHTRTLHVGRTML